MTHEALHEKLEQLRASRPLLRAESGLLIPVVIHDIREAWGRVDVRVSPKGGYGSVWVALERVKQDILGPALDALELTNQEKE